MGTDRELLELAAKAYGLDDAEYQDMRGWGEVRHGHSEAIHSDKLFDEQGTGYWNPLADDGDALRLAVKLNMTVRCYMGNTCAQIGVPGQPNAYQDVTDHADPLAATRRAIVRAAAEIGRQHG